MKTFARRLAAFMESTAGDIRRGLVAGLDRLWYG